MSLPMQVGCPRVLRPVCASNGLTYSNECVFRQIVCEQGLTDLSVVRHGRCEEEDEEAEMGASACFAVGLCTREWRPVCGSDGRNVRFR